MSPSRAVMVDPRNDARWHRLVARSDDALPFHHPAWLELLARTYGYQITAWAVEDARGELIAGLPVARVSSWLTGRRLVSLPFSDLCPIVTGAGAGADSEQLLAAAILESRRASGLDIELRCGLAVDGASSAGEAFWHHVVALEADVDAVVSRFSKSQVKRGIAKARRSGVTVRRATDREALDTFYRLHLQTRRRQGVPTQPKRFIRGFVDLFAAGLGWVLVAEWEEAPISAAVFLRAGTTVVYKYGASDHRHLDKRPNNLLFMEAIRMACEEGAIALDMGRTDLDNEGLRAFKRAWGAQERSLAYQRLATEAVKRPGGGIPSPARKVINSSPPLVGRVVGEVLYRHFA